MENHHVFARNSVNDDVLAEWKTAESGAQIVSAAPDIGVFGEEVKTFGEVFDPYQTLHELARTIGCPALQENAL